VVESLVSFSLPVLFRVFQRAASAACDAFDARSRSTSVDTLWTTTLRILSQDSAPASSNVRVERADDGH